MKPCAFNSDPVRLEHGISHCLSFLFTNQIMNTVTHNSLFNVLNLSNSIIFSKCKVGVVIRLVTSTCGINWGVLILSLLITSLNSIDSCIGHLSLGQCKKEGPCHHKLLFTNSEALVPLEGRSAGFITPGQCLQM